MDKFTQNLLRISLSLLCLTVPIGSLFILSEYLGYKKGIRNFAEEVSNQTEKFIEEAEESREEFIEKLIDMNPELEYWLD
tara:strand:- start:298 stop:537 length:240 start_codon:yes stop_codon:yes gene_type:complete